MTLRIDNLKREKIMTKNEAVEYVQNLWFLLRLVEVQKIGKTMHYTQSPMKMT